MYSGHVEVFQGIISFAVRASGYWSYDDIVREIEETEFVAACIPLELLAGTATSRQLCLIAGDMELHPRRAAHLCIKHRGLPWLVRDIVEFYLKNLTVLLV